MTAESPRRRLGFALLPIVIFAGLALVFWKGLSGVKKSIAGGAAALLLVTAIVLSALARRAPMKIL